MSERTEQNASNREFLAASAAVTPGSINLERRTVDCVFFTGADIPRYGWEGSYLLRFDPKGADLSLLNNGAPVLDNHNAYNGAAGQKGVVERAWHDGVYKATLRFSKRPDVDGLWQDIADKIVTKFSMGVELLAVTEKRDASGKLESKTATKWRPFELSVASIPADFGTTTLAGQKAVGAIAPGAERMNETKQNGAPVEAAAVTNPDAEQIRKVAAVCHLAAFGEDLINRGVGINEARAALIDKMAAEQPGIRHPHVEVTRDRRDGLVERMSEALACRLSGKAPSDAAREFMGARLADMAGEICRAHGIRTSWNAAETIKLAHSTSDFPNLLQNTGNRLMLGGYDMAQPQIKQLARIGTVPDFRAKTVIQLSEMPSLELVAEGGEITHGTRSEAAETYRAFTYGRMFSLTRQAIVNDDLGAWGDYFRAFGQSAAQLEARLLVGLLTANAGAGVTMADGKALFHADHGNLVESGAAISVDALGLVRKMLRLQTGLDGKTVLDITPKFLVTSATKETLAEQVLSAVAAAKVDDANPFTGKLTPICVPQLDADYATRWYIFGAPGANPVLELAYLEGAQGPQIDSRPGWEVLGAEYRCYIDIGVGGVNYRGAVCNPGA